MSQTIAYLRTSMEKQDQSNQKLEILEWVRKKDVKIDEFVQITMSSRKTRMTLARFWREGLLSSLRAEGAPMWQILALCFDFGPCCVPLASWLI